MMRGIARLAAGLLAIALWAAVVLVGMSGMTYFQPQSATVDVSNRGSARVADCRRTGPVSTHGIGYWWVCSADVVWESGDRQRVTVRPGQLTPDDGGRDVPVVERLVLGNKGGGPGSPEVYRADFEPSAVLGLGSLLAGIGLGGLLALVVFGSTLSRTKRKN